jgi:hypothetical protein
MIILALALAIAPAFTDCESHGKMLTTADGRSISMKCHWAGVAEVAAAIPLGLAGLYALFGKRKETVRFAGVIGAVSGVMALLLPTLLIGTCASPMMVCNLLMRPILLATGILAIIASIILVFTARESQPPAAQVPA